MSDETLPPFVTEIGSGMTPLTPDEQAAYDAQWRQTQRELAPRLEAFARARARGWAEAHNVWVG